MEVVLLILIIKPCEVRPKDQLLKLLVFWCERISQPLHGITFHMIHDNKLVYLTGMPKPLVPGGVGKAGPVDVGNSGSAWSTATGSASVSAD